MPPPCDLVLERGERKDDRRGERCRHPPGIRNQVGCAAGPPKKDANDDDGDDGDDGDAEEGKADDGDADDGGDGDDGDAEEGRAEDGDAWEG